MENFVQMPSINVNWMFETIILCEVFLKNLQPKAINFHETVSLKRKSLSEIFLRWGVVYPSVFQGARKTLYEGGAIYKCIWNYLLIKSEIWDDLKFTWTSCAENNETCVFKNRGAIYNACDKQWWCKLSIITKTKFGKMWMIELFSPRPFSISNF